MSDKHAAGKGSHTRPMSDTGRMNWNKFWDEKAELDRILERTNTPCPSTTTSAEPAEKKTKP
jgi:hypothetical protein